MQAEEKQGIIIVAVAYILWGFMPIYWKLLEHVSSDEILIRSGNLVICFYIVVSYYREKFQTAND